MNESILLGCHPRILAEFAAFSGKDGVVPLGAEGGYEGAPQERLTYNGSINKKSHEDNSSIFH